MLITCENSAFRVLKNYQELNLKSLCDNVFFYYYYIMCVISWLKHIFRLCLRNDKLKLIFVNITNLLAHALNKILCDSQMDIRGSPFGLLSAHPLAPLVSLHHLDYVQSLFPGTNRVDSVKRLIQAYKSDPSRTLQQSFCYDPIRNWSISVSWGYNVQLYPFLVTAKDLSTPLQTFLTFGSWSQEPFTFNTRVMSLKPCERPIIFYFDRVEGFGHGRTLTMYRRPRQDNRRQCDGENYAAAYSVKGFNVSAPLLHPTIWNKVMIPNLQLQVISMAKLQSTIMQNLK